MHVSPNTVRAITGKVGGRSDGPKLVRRGTQVYEMDVAGIGAATRAKQEATRPTP